MLQINFLQPIFKLYTCINTLFEYINSQNSLQEKYPTLSVLHIRFYDASQQNEYISTCQHLIIHLFQNSQERFLHNFVMYVLIILFNIGVFKMLIIFYVYIHL